MKDCSCEWLSTNCKVVVNSVELRKASFWQRSRTWCLINCYLKNFCAFLLLLCLCNNRAIHNQAYHMALLKSVRSPKFIGPVFQSEDVLFSDKYFLYNSVCAMGPPCHSGPAPLQFKPMITKYSHFHKFIVL